MAQYIVMPKLGLTMKEGSLHRWTVDEGDAVVKGQKLFEVETDKLTSDVEAPADGVIRKILLREGKVPVLTPVAILAGVDESIDALLAGAETAEAQKASPAAPKEEPGKRERKESRGGRIKASPKARRLAKELGVELADIEGTGPDGAIAEEDVRRAHETVPSRPMTPAADKEAKSLAVDTGQVPGTGRIYRVDVVDAASQDRWTTLAAPTEERRRITTMRRIIAERMVESQRVTAPVSYHLKVDARGLMRMKEELAPYRKVSYTDLLVKIVSHVLLDHPLLNASLEGDELVLRNHVNMGVAVALDDGLLVPVVRMSHVKPLGEVSRELRSLVDKARLNALDPDALEGATFTLTNLGKYSVEYFTPVINLPQAAILGVSALVDVPVPCEGGVAFIPMLPLSLTADHRIVDGAVAAAFIDQLKREIENPAGLVL